MEEKKRAQWGTMLGFILAAAGSAVGLGNIWKFPGRAFEGGGGAYIIIYIAIVLLIGIPVMTTELSIGRMGQANAMTSFKKLDKRFTWVGWLAVIIPFIITAYYAHVGGWVLRYVVSYLTESAAVYADPQGYFYGLLGYNAADGSTFFPWIALAFAAAFLLINAIVIIKGVENGIERFNKIGMPALFIMMILLLGRAITLEGSASGLKYLFSADWSKVTFSTFLSALGQAFYSLSLGMGIMITYGSYLKRDENISKNAVIISSCDTLVAILAAFIIIPACFATMGADNIGKGAGFAFISLAGVFENLPAGMVFGVVFYLLLLFAALTSCISLIEVMVAYLTEFFGWNRKKATIGLCIVLFLFGCLYTVSQASIDIRGIWFDFANGVTFPLFCDFMEFLTDRLLIPVCALGISIYAGWFCKPRTIIEEVRGGNSRFTWAKLYSFLIRYLVPAAIIVILVVSFATGTTLS